MSESARTLSAYEHDPGSARDIKKSGAWFQDGEGRYALFRGVNFASRSKLPPYLPVFPLAHKELSAEALRDELSRVRPYLDLLKDLGFNVVRLLVMWKGLSPLPDGNVSRDYLGALAAVIDDLYRRGLFVIVDFHQDIAHECYSGDGFPDWAIAVDDLHPEPATPEPRNPRWMLRYFDIALPPALPTTMSMRVRNSLRSFWRNRTSNARYGLADFTTQSSLVDTVAKTADYFKGHRAILGYEPFNEPHPVGLGKSAFETAYLAPFYDSVVEAVGRVDESVSVFIEPRVDWNIYPSDAPEFDCVSFVTDPQKMKSFLPPPSVPGRAVFSFHFYDPRTELLAALSRADEMEHKQKQWTSMFEAMVLAGRSRGLVPFLTEFGGDHRWKFRTDLRPAVYTTEIRAYLDLEFQQVESNLLNAALWSFNLYSTPEQGDNWNGESFSLLDSDHVVRNPDIVSRPYPLRSSAAPSKIFFDIETRHAAIVLRGLPVAAPTVVFVPRKYQYGDGFEVRASGQSLRWDDRNQWLYWLPSPGEEAHQVVICPRGAFDGDSLPEESRELLAKTTRRLEA